MARWASLPKHDYPIKRSPYIILIGKDVSKLERSGESEREVGRPDNPLNLIMRRFNRYAG